MLLRGAPEGGYRKTTTRVVLPATARRATCSAALSMPRGAPAIVANYGDTISRLAWWEVRVRLLESRRAARPGLSVPGRRPGTASSTLRWAGGVVEASGNFERGWGGGWWEAG